MASRDAPSQSGAPLRTKAVAASAISHCACHSSTITSLLLSLSFDIWAIATPFAASETKSSTSVGGRASDRYDTRVRANLLLQQTDSNSSSSSRHFGSLERTRSDSFIEAARAYRIRRARRFVAALHCYQSHKLTKRDQTNTSRSPSIDIETFALIDWSATHTRVVG